MNAGESVSIYQRIVAGEKLIVRLKNPLVGMQQKPFSVVRLLTMGENYSVAESSEWARFASVRGIIINGRQKHRMDQEEMQTWCSKLEIVA